MMASARIGMTSIQSSDGAGCRGSVWVGQTPATRLRHNRGEQRNRCRLTPA